MFSTWNSILLPVMTVSEPVITILPLTSSFAFGELVPIPTLPALSIVILTFPAPAV